MAWKALKQTSLADALLIEHSALTELDGMLTIINWHAIENKLAGMKKPRGRLLCFYR